MFERELKNAYIGEYIGKSANLKWSSLAQLQADWWTWVYFGGTYTWDSNGLTLPSLSDSSQSNKRIIVYYYTEAITPNSKVTLHATGYCARTYSSSSYAYNSAMFIWLYNAYENADWSTWFGAGYNASSWTWLKSWIGLNGTILWTQMSGNVGGDVDMTIEMDLGAKTATYTTTSPINQSTTTSLTDTQITTILNYKYVAFDIFRADKSVTTSLYTVSFRIEK